MRNTDIDAIEFCNVSGWTARSDIDQISKIIEADTLQTFIIHLFLSVFPLTKTPILSYSNIKLRS